ncbi:type II toxin-antitoxin system prevent-host-death family antitoxin [Pasteurella atlantica]|uniref:Type II toxin-antitoxin system prevent-host-death family antitoxin n=2 Tax=Pasteurellaceae TaxID=712 RepID=A0ACC6HPR6_9PAST|nr:type II toxin-antitoxin system prevent-host-death family antitoxin [Pasteurella atlantica]MDP8034551.1 type II toxin-antitoxin system prevent-host-death family antitoxin [Pasteurella atlantica]MDP8036501.1 type II toxin-antitoxin system prevent-host-death family antitoxin [Pasteurella atlantica]MDP8038429.1 type II toxin-antitoxin system prevent-host-death family antitoxin [Pasteurella atlantica]MDP8048800.1 type II toxin-antitoxin system prevent-host-death family antitoxin [Pasteurella atla
MIATAKDLRFHSKKLIESVNRGEDVIITYRGQPCARLVPYEAKENMNDSHQLFGMWKDNEMMDDVQAYVRHLRKGRF